MYGLIIFTLLSFTIGSISTETENVEMVPVTLSSHETRFVANFMRPLEDHQIININTNLYPKAVNITFQPNNPTSNNSVTMFIKSEDILADMNIMLYIALPWFDIVVNNQQYGTQYFPFPLAEYKIIIEHHHLSLYYMTQFTPFPNIMPFCEPIWDIDTNFEMYSSGTTMLKPGLTITVIGTLWKNVIGTNFSIDLTGIRSNNILLHFTAYYYQKVIVVNAMNDSLSWGQEQKIYKFPFQGGQMFKLVFGLTETSFKFAVNGIDLGTFNYIRNNVLDILNGIRVYDMSPMILKILSVETIQTGSPNVDNIAELSKW